MALFGKPKYTIVRLKKKEIPDGLWTKCEECGEVLYNKVLDENFKVCPKCDYHFILGAPERIKMLVDEGTFVEHDPDMVSNDPLDFKGPKTYKEKLAQDQAATGLKDAVITGECEINGKKTLLAVTDSRFIMGTMGSLVGEKITRAREETSRDHHIRLRRRSANVRGNVQPYADG
jgi:acetyl-CoA carboxylase carboxyl transferase subunit beta